MHATCLIEKILPLGPPAYEATPQVDDISRYSAAVSFRCERSAGHREHALPPGLLPHQAPTIDRSNHLLCPLYASHSNSGLAVSSRSPSVHDHLTFQTHSMDVAHRSVLRTASIIVQS